MKTLLEERERERDHLFWRSWELWTILGGVGIAALCLAFFFFRNLQADYQRRLDASALKSVVAIEQQIKKMREADAKAVLDRNHIKRDVDEIKEDIDEAPLLRAGKALRKAVDQLNKVQVKGE